MLASTPNIALLFNKANFAEDNDPNYAYCNSPNTFTGPNTFNSTTTFNGTVSGLHAQSIGDGTVSDTSFAFISGVTGPIQTQLNQLTTSNNNQIKCFANLRVYNNSGGTYQTLSPRTGFIRFNGTNPSSGYIDKIATGKIEVVVDGSLPGASSGMCVICQGSFGSISAVVQVLSVAAFSADYKITLQFSRLNTPTTLEDLPADTGFIEILCFW